MKFLSGCLLAIVAGAALAAQPSMATFPAQQRGPGDPALVERGKGIYTLYCRACHGPDLRGGDMGGPNLLRSQLVLNDQDGEAIGPVVRAGRVPAGGGTAMPPQPLPDDDLKAIAAYIRSVVFMAQPQGAPPPGAEVKLNRLVGHARAGARHFRAQCAGCHAPDGDLAGIGARLTDIEQLQNSWVSGRRIGPPATDPARRAVRVTVKFDDGTAVAGTLVRLDDFTVSLRTESGEYRSFTRRMRQPAITGIDVNDPTAQHRALWTTLTNQQMHDVTAYLATLK